MSNIHIFAEKLRSLGLRPTQQRIIIYSLLFDRKDTFHFTIDDLQNILKNTSTKKISLATIYNTIRSLKDKGYLKEISINSEKTYFDTNISKHHHFFDESKRELIDLNDKDVGKIKIKKAVPGKKITSIEVLVKIANNN